LRDLILEQARINDNIVRKFASNDKILEDINAKMNDFSSAIKDQLNHNKKIETQLAQLVAALPVATNPEHVQAITTRVANPLVIPHIQKGQRGDRQHQWHH
jgi:ubiquinone biosynthesis protein COQ9